MVVIEVYSSFQSYFAVLVIFAVDVKLFLLVSYS